MIRKLIIGISRWLKRCGYKLQDTDEDSVIFKDTNNDWYKLTIKRIWEKK